MIGSFMNDYELTEKRIDSWRLFKYSLAFGISGYMAWSIFDFEKLGIIYGLASIIFMGFFVRLRILLKRNET
jgi:hypothetical protein